MSSVLTQWWREARAASASEREAVAVIAGRLGESESETRRLLGEVAKVRLQGAPVRRSAPTAKPAARPVVSVNDGNGHPPRLDEDAVRRFYRTGRESGLNTENALRAAAKRFRTRPHDVRAIVNAVEIDVDGAA